MIDIGLKSDESFFTNEPEGHEEGKEADQNQGNQEAAPVDYGLGMEEKAYREFVFHLQQNANMGFDVAHALKAQLTARRRALEFYGKIMAFFFICAAASTYYCAKNIILYKQNENKKLNLDLFSYLMPFVSFLIDACCKKAYCLTARSFYAGLRVLLTFYYLSIYVVSLSKTSDSAIYWLANTNLFGFPALITLYWQLLIRGKLS